MPAIGTRAVTGLTGGQPATFEDYQQLFTTDMRPAKFSETEASLQLAGRGMPMCSDCQHFYVNPISRRSVCEVVRRPNEANISPKATCKFQNRDGSHYPLLEVL